MQSAVEVKERPILFSGDMVRALLEGQKTQTRRVIQPQPEYQGHESYGDSWKWKHGSDEFSGVTTEQLVGHAGLCHPSRTVYGQPGDRLWVRETWTMNEPPSGAIYRATDQDSFRVLAEARVKQGLDLKWHPAIFMPRRFSRIALEITGTRVERVQQITDEDAIAEGCPGTECYRSPRFIGWVTDSGQLPSEEYRDLWNSINAKRGFGWDRNPWVWVIEFKRV